MKFKLKPFSLAIAIIVLMFGGIAVGGSMNYWVTKSSKVPATYTSGEFKGVYNPADIRGSYSFEDIGKNFEIPVEHLAIAFGLSDDIDTNSYQCKKLESDYAIAAEKGFEIGTDSVRIFVALYKGLPIELEDTYIPAAAYQVLKDNANLTQEQINYLDAHTVDISKLEAVQAAEAPSAAAPAEDPQNQENGTKETDGYNSADQLVKGKTTFAELMDWGVSKEEIEQVLGTEMPNAALTVRDFCAQQGMEFSAIKEALQNIVDNK